MQSARVLQEQSGLHMEHLAQLTRLNGADRPLARQGFMYVATLAKDGQQIRRRFARVFKEELQAFGRCRVVRRHPVPAIVIFNQEHQ
jgi:hypothetical protein